LKLLGSGLHESRSPVLSLEKKGPCDCLDIIIKHGWEKAVADTLVSFIGQTTHLWDEMSLQNIREDGVFLNYVVPVLTDCHYPVEKKTSNICPRVILPDSLDKYLSSLSPPVRQNLLSARDNYLHDPDCTIEDVCKKGNISGGLQSLSHLHQKRWNNLGYPGFFMDPDFEAFQRELTGALAQKKWLWFKKLRYKGKNIVTQLGFKFNGSAHVYLSDYDKDRSAISPGNADARDAALVSMIEEAIKSDCEVLDFGHREPIRMLRFSQNVIHTFTVTVRSPENALHNQKKRRWDRFTLHKIFSFFKRLNFRINYETTIAKLISRQKGTSKIAEGYVRHLLQRTSATRKRDDLHNKPEKAGGCMRLEDGAQATVRHNGQTPRLKSTGASERDLSTEQITNHVGVYNLCKEWKKLEASACNPLLTSEWFISGVQTFCPPDDIQMITTKCKGKLKALAPLSVKGKFMPVLELVGSSTLEEPGGFLYEDHASLTQLIRTMLDLNKPLHLRGFRYFSPETQILENELKTRRRISLVKEEKIPWVAITGTWKNFETNMSSSRRSSLRRLQRLAEKKGEVRFIAVTPTPENLDDYLEEIFRIEASNWKGRIGTAIKTHPNLRKFFTLYSQKASKQNKLHLFFLRINEKTVAVQLTVVHANRLWIYKIGHDENWSYCSPGILLMHKVIRFCFEQGLTACEFLGSDEPWLHIWADEFHSLCSYKIYPKSVKGITGLMCELIHSYSYGISKLIYRKMTRLASMG